MSQDKSLIPNEKLKREREKRGWSQEEVAEQVGVQYTSTVSDWETGKHCPSPHFRKKLCKLFDMNADELGFTKQKVVSTKEERCETSRETNNAIFQNTEMTSFSTYPPFEEPLACPPTQDVPLSLDQRTKHAHTDESYCDSEKIPPASSLSDQPPPPSRYWRNPAILLIGSILVVTFVLLALHFSLSISPPPSSQATPFSSIKHDTILLSTIHQEQQKCTLNSNKAEYLKIFTKRGGNEEVLCFSGTGTLDVSIEYVRKVETGNLQANWTYFSIDGKKHISPTSTDPSLYWCPGNRRTYDNLISIQKITIASPSPEKRCVDRTSSA